MRHLHFEVFFAVRATHEAGAEEHSGGATAAAAAAFQVRAPPTPPQSVQVGKTHSVACHGDGLNEATIVPTTSAEESHPHAPEQLRMASGEAYVVEVTPYDAAGNVAVGCVPKISHTPQRHAHWREARALAGGTRASGRHLVGGARPGGRHSPTVAITQSLFATDHHLPLCHCALDSRCDRVGGLRGGRARGRWTDDEPFQRAVIIDGTPPVLTNGGEGGAVVKDVNLLVMLQVRPTGAWGMGIMRLTAHALSYQTILEGTSHRTVMTLACHISPYSPEDAARSQAGTNRRADNESSAPVPGDAAEDSDALPALPMHMACDWSGLEFRDPESNVAGYMWAVSSDGGASDDVMLLPKPGLAPRAPAFRPLHRSPSLASRSVLPPTASSPLMCLLTRWRVLLPTVRVAAGATVERRGATKARGGGDAFAG